MRAAPGHSPRLVLNSTSLMASTVLTSAVGLAYWALAGVGSQAVREGLSALAALAGTAAGLGLVWRHDKKVRDARGGPSGRFEVRVCAKE